MAAAAKVLILMAMVVSLVSIGYARKGTATFYTELVPSACFGTQNEGEMVAAASAELWRNRAACGTTLSVRCAGATNEGVPHPCRGKQSVLVKIVDFCPGCQGISIDLSRQAFSRIADPDAGKIQIEFQRV